MSEEMKMDETLDMVEMDDESLEDISGGKSGSHHGKRKVGGLKKGYLAMRTAKCYDYKNEMRGHELYNGDKVKIVKSSEKGTDGRYYTRVRSEKDGAVGWVNSAYLKRY